jgi:uridine kinase
MPFSADVRPRVTLVDGRSGSGKTTWASALAVRTGARLLSLDEVYPGWDGLEAAERHVIDSVLIPLAAGRAGSYQTWDWAQGRAGPSRAVDAARPLVVEGCGALSAESRALAHRGVWIELDALNRRERAIARDGELFARQWERWARQEEWHERRHSPRAHADVIIDGSSGALLSLSSAPER